MDHETGLIPPRPDDTQTQIHHIPHLNTDNTFTSHTSPTHPTLSCTHHSHPSLFYIVSFFFSYLLLHTLIYLGLDLDSLLLYLLLLLLLALLYCTIVYLYFVGLSKTTNTIKLPGKYHLIWQLSPL